MFKKPVPHPQTCERCPNRYSERGCPCWMAVTETNEVTGEVRARQGCFYQIVLEWMATLATAGNRHAAATTSMRNELVRGLEHMVLMPPPCSIPLEAIDAPKEE